MKFLKTQTVVICLFAFTVAVTEKQMTGQNAAILSDDSISVGIISKMVANLEPKGWKLQDRVEIYSPMDLYERINGRAEYYLSYDMVWAVFGVFRRNTDNRHPVELSIFNMGNPTHAFGAFSGERSMGAPLLNFGRDSYYSEPTYYIWHGQYYIQITASDTTYELHQACLDLADKLTKNLVDPGQSLWGFEILPAKDRVPQSVQYFLVDALGHSFLHDTYTAKYFRDEIEIPVFLSHQDSPASATEIIKKYKGHVNKYGKGVETSTIDGVEVIVCDMGKYYDVIFQKGSFVAGIIGLRDKNIAIEASTDFWKQLQIE